jgi:uncharacterized protein related to proFAR isomerase
VSCVVPREPLEVTNAVSQTSVWLKSKDNNHVLKISEKLVLNVTQEICCEDQSQRLKLILKVKDNSLFSRSKSNTYLESLKLVVKVKDQHLF